MGKCSSQGGPDEAQLEDGIESSPCRRAGFSPQSPLGGGAKACIAEGVLDSSPIGRPIQQGPLSDREIGDEFTFPMSSEALGGYLLNFALDRSTSSFAVWLQFFCEERGADMVEGVVEQKFIFPLPLPSASQIAQYQTEQNHRELWFCMMVASLNYMHGGGQSPFSQEAPSQIQSRILEFLRGRVEAFCSRVFLLERFDWLDFFKTRKVSYCGEEVKAA